MGGLIIALISIYPTPELLGGEYISGGMLSYLGCLGLLIRDHSEFLFLRSSLIQIWEILTFSKANIISFSVYNTHS